MRWQTLKTSSSIRKQGQKNQSHHRPRNLSIEQGLSAKPQPWTVSVQGNRTRRGITPHQEKSTSHHAARFFNHNYEHHDDPHRNLHSPPTTLCQARPHGNRLAAEPIRRRTRRTQQLDRIAIQPARDDVILVTQQRLRAFTGLPTIPRPVLVQPISRLPRHQPGCSIHRHEAHQQQQWRLTPAPASLPPLKQPGPESVSPSPHAPVLPTHERVHPLLAEPVPPT